MPRSWADVVLPALSFLLCFTFAYGPDAVRMSVPGAVAASSAAAAVVWVSGHRPGAALLLVVLLALLLPLIQATFQALDLVVVLVAFRAAAGARLPTWLLAAGALVALSVNDAWLRLSTDRTFLSATVLYPALLTALGVGLGRQSRRVSEQHAELVALRDVDRQRAVSEERRRIARDLHDVAAHHLTALVVRNKLARRLDTVPALQEAADFTARTAADALESLREVVSVLSTGDAAPLEPQPALRDIDLVVDRMRAAGLQVERRASTALPAHPVELDIAVVRIVQEALTNVLRHRGPGRAWLDLRAREECIVLTVDDDGPARSSSSPPSDGRRRHYGLLGMRERAEACGGVLTVGPSPRGGWRVQAEFPLARERA